MWSQAKLSFRRPLAIVMDCGGRWTDRRALLGFAELSTDQHSASIDLAMIDIYIYPQQRWTKSSSLGFLHS